MSHGTPIWIDLSTTDLDASRAFYGDLFGWTATDPVAEFGGYLNFLDGEDRVAGAFPIEPGTQPVGWRTYVSVPDAEVTAAKITAAGGSTTIAPMVIGDLGHMGVFTDTIGAEFGIWRPGMHRGAGKFNEPVSLAWNELTVAGDDKTVAASEFYGAVFGWTSENSDMGGMQYTTFGVDDRGIAGMISIGDASHANLPSFWNVYFAVADCDATFDKAMELGASKIRGATDIPIGRFAVATDPQGATFSFIALASA